ncbi:MAG: spermidine/putrescine ABC transporter ATP-binding protein [Rhodospirillaceae bacterium]|nr:spermidine/putrescine ABC transporter ATP-binding protein [Rhodospirillaceae bacterium]
MQGKTSSKSEPTVEIRNVSKWFGEVAALDNVSLNIQQGEFFSLLGPSGCGKTTLLRMIGGFESPSEGQILIDGTDTIGEPPYARSTNMIFQHLALFPHMNVIENVAFGLKMKSFQSDTIDQKVQESLELVRLEGYGQRKIDQLSGGQKQRVAMARALINNPSVLLLDEPLGALDLQLRLQMQDELRRLHKSLGNTFIFVTHDQGEAMAMSDRIAVMDQGHILQVGTPEDIYETPKTRFVADFVGHTNVFDGNVTKIEENGECLVSSLDLVFRCITPDGLTEGQPVSIALRFEDVSVENTTEQLNGTSISVLVTEKMYLGGMFRFKNITEDGTELTADAPNKHSAQSISEGDTVTLSWRPTDISVLIE